MSEQKLPKTLQCYVIPSLPLPLLLPRECVAQVIEGPKIEELSKGAAKWMIGHVNWNDQRIPVMNYSSLQNAKLDSVVKLAEVLVVLNPVPNAARKAFSSLLCNGRVTQIDVDVGASLAKAPESVDNRYVEAVVEIAGEQYIVPRLAAISVAFSYF